MGAPPRLRLEMHMRGRTSRSWRLPSSSRAFLVMLTMAAAGCSTGGVEGPIPPGSAAAPPSPGAQGPQVPSGVESAFAGVRYDPARLYPFLRDMPKGGDLHTHLSGAVYAESFLRWAAEDGRCVDVARLTIVAGTCDAAVGRPTAADANADQSLRDRLIDAFSTRNYRPDTENGHERFFTTFDRFGVAGDGRTGDMIAEVQSRAARGRVSYVEVMNTIGGIPPMAFTVEWNDDIEAMRSAFLAAGLSAHVDGALAGLTDDLARRDVVLGCGTVTADPGCGVELRFLYQVLRAFPRPAVFGMILAGFEMAARDGRVVGFNLVQPEDHRVAMEDYSLHMRIIGALSPHYPNVRVSLHAGELWEGLVPPEGLRFHVREAVEIAGARRIGHGVDILHEDDPEALLRTMAEQDVMVEINLTSNDVILGVSGEEHPLRAYLDAGVPVALSTDDEGVSRSEMTVEYVRAVEDQGLDYVTLRHLARNSLEYAFVEGVSVWADTDPWEPVPECSAASGGWQGLACVEFARSSTRARLQRQLELDFRGFEARW